MTRPCLSSGQARASPVWPSPALACRVRWRSPTCPACAPFCGTTRRRNKLAPPPRDGFGKNRKIVGKSQKRIEPEPLVAAIPADVAVAVAPLRWGAETDVANLNAAFRNPRVVLGADLAYTENAAVVEKLAATVRACVPRGGVAVFASCRDHRPESVDLLEALLLEGGAFEARRVRGEELAPGFGRRVEPEPRDEDEPRDEGSQTAREFDESFRVVEFRRVAGTPCPTRRRRRYARVTRAGMRGSIRFGSLSLGSGGCVALACFRYGRGTTGNDAYSPGARLDVSRSRMLDADML